VGAGVIDGVQLTVGVEHGDGRRGVDTDGFAHGEVFETADGNHGPPTYQLTLPQISDVFQFVGDGTGKYDVATNAVVLATVLILFTTLVNAFGVKLMATINSAGVLIELVATVVLIVLFAVHITRGPQVVTDTQGTGTGYSAGYLGAFLVASLASAYVTYGFDTTASLGEESLNPSRNAPRAIIRAIVASFVLGGLVLLLALMRVSSLTGDKLSTDGLQYVVLDVLGPPAGKAMLWCVLIAVTSARSPCTRPRSGWPSRWPVTTTFRRPR
jgi:amino acid transporter